MTKVLKIRKKKKNVSYFEFILMVTFDEPMVFNVTWFDEMGVIDRPYRLLFYPMDNSVEIIDTKSGKVHLRRIRNFEVQKEYLFVGN